jgi:hypothetical protein
MAAADFQIEDGGPGLTLRLTGDWTATELGRISRRLDDELSERCVDAVDLSELGRFDTAGALAIVQASNCVLPPSAWTQRPEAGRTYALVEKLERESAGPAAPVAGLGARPSARSGAGVHGHSRRSDPVDGLPRPADRRRRVPPSAIPGPHPLGRLVQSGRAGRAGRHPDRRRRPTSSSAPSSPSSVPTC